MSKSKITEIGEIDSISGNTISVKLFDNIKSNMPIIDGVVYRVGQIGSFVRIPLGYANLYGLVTQIGSSAIPDSLKDIYYKDYDTFKNTIWISVVLAGEQVGKRFERGVTQYPTTGDKVHLVTINDLDIIYGGYEESNSISVGNISVSESLDAKIDLDKLISRHCAIVGSTGSGKSNSVSVLLEAIAKRNFPSARILVIDPHGEYNDALSKYSRVIESNPKDNNNKLYIPFWALPFNELINIFSGNLTDANREYIREKVVVAKVASAQANKIDIPIQSITADTPIPFSIKQLWFELDDFERQTFIERAKPETITQKINGNAEKLMSNSYVPASAGGGSPFLNNNAKGILGFLDSMRNRLNDLSYNFLFTPGEFLPNLQGKINSDIDSLFSNWLGNSLPITILDLSGIPSEIMSSISGTLLKIIYDGLFWGVNTKVGGKNQPLLIVLEEAHSYLKAGENSISSRTVQMIAKEGRKYGVGLLLVTQRPSELDDTVLSQCGTMIALRMNNSRDRSHIRSAVQDELQSIVDLLPSLRTGEALISGEAVKIPSRVKFSKISNAPKSSDPKASEKWLEKIENIGKEYKLLLNAWRRKNYKS
ncbi:MULTISPECIES: ATP-binding protein [Leptospira]|uniref:ATP-binding protein n=1 Tax=Leptospira TaxID=171 RepID=UPI001090DD00|nr:MULTISPECIES: ATP-binding protein [Leptospira]TGL99677.1 ATP-binding protein [Leptospira jelokensis]TGM80495.1 ATP-binding protein [Leptospira bouyouniensis]